MAALGKMTVTMDTQQLIDDITDLVCQRLAHPNAVAGGPASLMEAVESAVARLVGSPPPPEPEIAEPAPPKRGRVLVVLGEGERGLGCVPEVSVQAVRCGFAVRLHSAQRFDAARSVAGLVPAAQVGIEPVPSAASIPWADEVRGSRLVIVPNLSLSALSGIASLTATEPSAAAVIAALVEGIPVMVGADEIHFLTLNAAHLSKPFQDILRGHLGTVQSLGVKVCEGGALAECLKVALTAPVAATVQGRGRGVLTAEDVESLLRTRPPLIEVAAGTIVTPLARDVAESAGVSIVFR